MPGEYTLPDPNSIDVDAQGILRSLIPALRSDDICKSDDTFKSDDNSSSNDVSTSASSNMSASAATFGMHPECFDQMCTSDSCEAVGWQDYDDTYLFSTCNASTSDSCEAFGRQDYDNTYLFSTCTASTSDSCEAVGRQDYNDTFTSPACRFLLNRLTVHLI